MMVRITKTFGWILIAAAATLGLVAGCGNKSPSPQETASVHTDTVATDITPDSGDGETRDIEIEMAYVAGGTFTMGCTLEHGEDCDDDESPTHSVTLSDYYMGKYEVTQKQWRDVMGSLPVEVLSIYGIGDNYPVYDVNWNNVVNNFIPRLNALTGKNYRLSTEAEWEYAARGGKSNGGYKYSGSNNIGDVAWHWDNIPSQSSYTSGYGTQPVGTKKANELGIYDMSGNVWEWVSDWYGSYSSSSQTNPEGPQSGSNRVLRGGSWNFFARNGRVSIRYGHDPDFRSGGIGFRLVLSP